MAVLAFIVIFAAVVVWLATRQSRIRARSCCSSGSWPPVDLVDDPAYARDASRVEST